VSRDPPSYSGQPRQNTPSQIATTLSPAEREITRASGIDEVTYAKNKPNEMA
jgi:hypothetical protein